MDLISKGSIRVHDAPLFHTSPSPLHPSFDFNKVEGMLLGAAIGDSLGAPSEGMTPMDRNNRFGQITNFIPGKHPSHKALGYPTDDTQLTFWTLKQLLKDDGLIPEHLIRAFSAHRVIGIGNTVKQAIVNFKDRNLPWYRCGLDSLGNGALMRISPMVIPGLRSRKPSISADAAMNTMLTHNSFANIASCVAFTNILWELLSMKSSPQPRWWLDRYCYFASELEGNTSYLRGTTYSEAYRGPLWKYTLGVVNKALSTNLTVREACDEWGSGANLFETVPSVLYILAQHARAGEEAIIRAVNDTKDNDTIASIVGAAIGALHGKTVFPNKWIKNLTGRTRAVGDNGAVFELIAKAKEYFWE